MFFSNSQQVASPSIKCKVCEQGAKLAGVVDFSKCGLDYLSDRKVTPYVGVPIYYYCCNACGFVFTQAMDRWSANDYAQKIYNSDYTQHDPDYLGKRPKEYAKLIHEGMQELNSSKILDYGSGLGLLEKGLKEFGFDDVDSFDPFTHQKKPQKHAYDVVLAIEVFEHHPQPKIMLQEIKRYLKPEGVILFSTLLINQATIDDGIANWWYCAPRNGHISFYSFESLTILARNNGFRYVGSLSPQLHAMFHNRSLVWLERYL